MPPLPRQIRLLRAYALFTYPFACIPFLWFYFAGEGISLSGYGQLIGWYYLAMFLCELPTGVLADRLGRTALLVLGPILLALGFATIWLWRDYAGFCTGEVVLGLGHAVMSGPASALLYDTLRQHGQEHRFLVEESRLHGQRLLGTGGSFLLGGVIAWLLAAADGAPDFAATIPLTCVLCLVAAAVALGLRETGNERPPAREFLRQVGEDLRQPAVLWLLVYFVILFALLRYPFHNYQVWLDEASGQHAWLGDPLVIGTLYALLNLLAVPFSRLVPALVQRHGRRVLFWSMPLSLALSFLLMAQLGPLGVALFFAQQVPFGMHWALVQEFVNHRIRPASRTTVLSSLSLGGRVVFAGLCIPLFHLQEVAGTATALTVVGWSGIGLTCACMWLRPRGLLRGMGPVA